MFTGIIEELGDGGRRRRARLRVRCSTVMQDLTEGASIAVNGVCLTAVGLRPDAFCADLAPGNAAAHAISAICGRGRA